MTKTDYVHGYSDRESTRLSDQANTLAELLHGDTHYPAGSRVLECGCGTGAQTLLLAGNSPEAHITSVDLSQDSLNQAEALIREEGFSKKTFIAMVEGAKEQALALNLIDEASWEKGIRDMMLATEPYGTFCYTFFKGVGRR